MSTNLEINIDPKNPAQINISGELTLLNSEWALERLTSLRQQGNIDRANLAALSNMDTSGAYVLVKALQKESITLDALPAQFADILERVRETMETDEGHSESPEQLNPVARVGQFAFDLFNRGVLFLAFFGQVCLYAWRVIIQPWRLRIPQIVNVIDNAGVRALGIVALLNFLIGVVIAYQGGEQLKVYGANIFIVPMVCITVLRELAPLITAIIVAGRTGASITAQIGSMKVSEEIDAMETLGMSPYEVLYLPRIFGLIIALPLLTLFADVAAIFGGMVIAASMLDISFSDFIARIPATVPASALIVGLVKTPIFAATIALVSCYQGQRVQNNAESVGKQTTVAVVQSIFLVIVLDAIFSILFNLLGIPVLKE